MKGSRGCALQELEDKYRLFDFFVHLFCLSRALRHLRLVVCVRLLYSG